MKRTPVKSVLALVLAFMIAVGGITVNPITAQAAAKPTKITLSAKKQTVAVGKSFTLKVKSVTPKKADKGVKFKSSKTSVATVNSKGKVTGKKAGTAKITVTSKKNSKVKATCTVTVKPAVTSITGTNLVLKKGKTGTIKVSVSPSKADKGATFKSSKKSVATVDSKGKVKAKKAGKATITVTAKDGSKKSTKCTVVVVNKITKIKKATVSPSKTTLNVGKTVTLKTKVTSPKKGANNVFNWKSNKTSVATVDTAGKVKAVAPGTATIKGTAADGSKKTVKATITVVQPVTGVTLAPARATVKVGATTALKATVLPANASNKAVTWATSNANVATVANGVVTGRAAGTATITVRTADGNKVASATITVVPNEVAVTGVTLDKTTAELKANETLTLNATVAPANATNKTVTWATSDVNVATVANGVVTPVAAGTAKITATAGGKSATCEVTVVAEKSARVDTDTEFVYSIDKKAESYKSDSRSVTNEEFIHDLASVKTLRDKLANKDAALKATIEEVLSQENIEKLLILGDKVTSVKNEEDGTYTVTVKETEDSIKIFKVTVADVEAVATEGTETEETTAVETCTIKVEQLKDEEVARTLNITGITRTINEDGSVVLTGAVNNGTEGAKAYDIEVTVNADASAIVVNRVVNDTTKVPALTYTNTDETVTVSINKAYYAEANKLYELNVELPELINVYTK